MRHRKTQEQAPRANRPGLPRLGQRGEQFIIARGQKAVARLLPAEEDGVPDAEREDWTRAAMANLARACGPDEPDYSAAAIIEPNPQYRP